MNKLKLLTLSLTILTFSVCGQTKDKNYDNYTELEKKTDNCLDDWFDSKNVSWTELKVSFENYFSSSEITNPKDSIEKQYLDILSFIERPTRQFPVFKDKKKIIAVKNQLGLSNQDIYYKNQLDCFTNFYVNNKLLVDKTSSYYAFGSSFETIKRVPDISPGLLAGAIKMAMDKKDLKKDLYQKTIVLMYYFNFTLFLKDGNE